MIKVYQKQFYDARTKNRDLHVIIFENLKTKPFRNYSLLSKD